MPPDELEEWIAMLEEPLPNMAPPAATDEAEGQAFMQAFAAFQGGV